MTRARNQQICLDATEYYHCVSRCVRSAFLCGVDKETGVSYEHRRGWVEERLFALTQVFCIDICAYAIMSNHYHLVLHVNRQQASALSDLEVIDRWITFHLPPVLIQKYLRGEIHSTAERAAALKIINLWRERLYSISWMMKLLNQFIATEANKEDACTGHFWEGRFKSQALLDDKALIAAMAYVDLNPVRAGISDTPESSDFTSIQSRINAVEGKNETPKLYPLIGDKQAQNGIPIRLVDYIQLVDWTGRRFREQKQGQIHPNQPPILERLALCSDTWIHAVLHLSHASLAGEASTIKRNLHLFGRQRMTGYRFSQPR
ncbi:transposase [Photobacterium sp. 1_MG-2023]|uniref:transposase n=1 Tax=Photobacterium sp. 1_MG-2023 TaxID=3062646 RepID=UPI0026E30CE2|nr:transposase [Photobacterium sp. 1_MG-2023]MDO6706888.1 transposase [Photobacterium sp. 1_MG-2023]